jgi:hypothetical protein
MTASRLFASVLLATAALIAGTARGQENLPAFEDRELEALASPELMTFASEQEFTRYLRDARRIYRKRHPRRRGRDWSLNGTAPEIVVAQAEIAPIDCDLEVMECPDQEDTGEATVVVTGSRVSTPTITNVQVAGVDEGDIVKQIGEYLLVLQDGRIFAIHYPTMRLTDRADVYRRDADGDPIGADWYDEMLVQGDQVIITAYDYGEDASEISVFRLDQASGRIARRGVFLISSDDYYDSDNYATRIIGDRLVIHTPYDTSNLGSREGRPLVRRWQPDESRAESLRRGRRLFNARNIYRPVFAVEEPVVHTISICPLGDVTTRGLDCETTGFVGTEQAEMFVSPDSVYLWLSAISWEDWGEYECPGLSGRAAADQIAPAAVMRLPVGRGDPVVMSARGVPFDQFSMDEFEGRFRALVSWRRDYCEQRDDEDRMQQVALLDEPRSAFGPVYREARDGRFVALPDPAMRVIENRFAGDWLIYGGRHSYSGRPYDYDDEAAVIPREPAIAVPLRDPSASIRVDQPHNIIRIERVGDDIVINGYRDLGGLNISYLDLGATARIASTLQLDNRFESEGRSHAFNSTVSEVGGGILGIPTVERIERAGRYWWWSGPSDLNYVTFDTGGRLADAGLLEGRTEEEVETAPGYDCEVSCIDWYGNARPFFLGGKVFGLMATELVEAELVAGKVAERRRLDLTGPIAAR